MITLYIQIALFMDIHWSAHWQPSRRVSLLAFCPLSWLTAHLYYVTCWLWALTETSILVLYIQVSLILLYLYWPQFIPLIHVVHRHLVSGVKDYTRAPALWGVWLLHYPYSHWTGNLFWPSSRVQTCLIKSRVILAAYGHTSADTHSTLQCWASWLTGNLFALLRKCVWINNTHGNASSRVVS